MLSEKTSKSIIHTLSRLVVEFLIVVPGYGTIDAWGSMKMLYHRRCVATVYTYVAKETPNALQILKSYTDRIAVHDR